MLIFYFLHVLYIYILILIYYIVIKLINKKYGRNYKMFNLFNF